MKIKKPIPFAFVLDELDAASPHTRPMFGCTAVYVGEKIVFILRQQKTSPKENGVWICTTADHHPSLKKEFPSMRSIALFESKGTTGWQVLPEKASDFEESVIRAVNLVMRNDPRIGKIPNKKVKRRKLPG